MDREVINEIEKYNIKESEIELEEEVIEAEEKIEERDLESQKDDNY